MEGDAVELFEEGAKVLTQEMVKGGWTVVQSWITRVFRGDEAKKQKALDELEESRQELTEAGESVSAEDVEQNWKTQLRRLLREDPEAAAELRAILDEVAPERGAQSVTNIAHDVHGTLIQAGSIHGGVHQSETRYGGDHIDMRDVKAKGDVVGTQHDHGDGRRKS